MSKDKKCCGTCGWWDIDGHDPDLGDTFNMCIYPLPVFVFEADAGMFDLDGDDCLCWKESEDDPSDPC